MREISIAIPTYRRPEMTLQSFLKVYSDERITEIVIVDDCSPEAEYEVLKKLVTPYSKVRLFRNEVNLDCYRNKAVALGNCINEWAILLDSDNVIDRNYIYEIFSLPVWDSSTIYTPSFAYPHFDFRAFAGLLITRSNVHEWIREPMFETMLNAANYFVNVNTYTKLHDTGTDPITSDSIFTCYNWLSAGNRIRVLENLLYEHKIHEGSHYKNNVHRTPDGFHNEIIERLAGLR